MFLQKYYVKKPWKSWQWSHLKTTAIFRLIELFGLQHIGKHNFLSVFVFIKVCLFTLDYFFPVFKVFIGIPSEARLFSNSDLVYLYQLFANVSTALVTFFSLTSILLECLPIIFQIPQILSTQNTKQPSSSYNLKTSYSKEYRRHMMVLR